MTYHREQAEKEKAEFYAEQARQANPEYHELLAKLDEARKSAHMTSLWQEQKGADEIAEKSFEMKKYADPEWARLKAEKKSTEWKEE